MHVSLFMLSGPTLILLQKYVLGILNFEYPIFIVTLAAVSRWILVLLLVHTGTIKLGAHKDLTFMEWTRGMLPVGILECVSLAAGSTAYLHLSVSFVQMLKAFQPVVLNVFIVGLGLEKFSFRLFACILVVTIGSILAAIGEVNFTPTGVWLMLISELAESAKARATRLMPGVALEVMRVSEDGSGDALFPEDRVRDVLDNDGAVALSVDLVKPGVRRPRRRNQEGTLARLAETAPGGGDEPS